MDNKQLQAHRSYSRWKHDAVTATVAGLGATLLVFVGSLLIGRASPFETRLMVEAIMPTSRFLFSGVMTASATILALMLTMLGMIIGIEKRVAPTFFRRIQQIAFYNMLLLVMSTIFLLMHCVPIAESDEIPTWWYPVWYYFLLGSSALTGGGVVAVVVMLYSAVRDMIHAIGLETDVGLFIDEEELMQDDADSDDNLNIDAK